MQTSEIHNKIKQNTKYLHDKLELMEIPKKIYNLSISKDEYLNYLVAFSRIHHLIEKEFLNFNNDWNKYDFSISKYLRSDLLQKDLLIMSDNQKIDIDIYNYLVNQKIDSFAKAIGYLYVLTGSTIGGKILSKKIEENFVGSKYMEANHYFSAFKEETDVLWSVYLEFLNRYMHNNEDNPQIEKDFFTGVTQCYELVIDGFHALNK